MVDTAHTSLELGPALGMNGLIYHSTKCQGNDSFDEVGKIFSPEMNYENGIHCKQIRIKKYSNDILLFWS